MRSSASFRTPSVRRFQHQSRIGVTLNEAIPVDRLLAAVAGRYGAALDEVATLAATEPLPVLHLVASEHRADRDARSHGLLHLRLFGFMKLRFWGRRGSGSVHAADIDTKGDPHLAVVKLSRWLRRLGLPEGVALRRVFSVEVYVVTASKAVAAAAALPSAFVPAAGFETSGTALVCLPGPRSNRSTPVHFTVRAYLKGRYGDVHRPGPRKVEVCTGVPRRHARRATIEGLRDVAAYLAAYFTLRYGLPSQEPPGHWVGIDMGDGERRAGARRLELLRTLAPSEAGPPFPIWHRRMELRAAILAGEGPMNALLRGLVAVGAVECRHSARRGRRGEIEVRMTDLGALMLARAEGRPDPDPLSILGPFYSEVGKAVHGPPREGKGAAGITRCSRARPGGALPYGVAHAAREGGFGRHAQPRPTLVEVSHPVEAEVLAAMRAASTGKDSWLSRGRSGSPMSSAEVAAALNAAGVETRSGRSWTRRRVEQVVRAGRAPRGTDPSRRRGR